MYRSWTTPDGAQESDGIDGAVESACRLFLITKALLNSGAEELGRCDEDVKAHMDFVEGMASATVSLIQEKRVGGVNAYDSNCDLYDNAAAVAYSVLGKTCAKYSMAIEEEIVGCREGMFDDIAVPETTNDAEHDQDGTHLLVGGCVGSAELPARVSDTDDEMGEGVVEVSHSDRLVYDMEEIPQHACIGIFMRLSRILGRLVDGQKRGVKSLWVCAYKTKLESHEIEEDYAFSRLLSGYGPPNHDLIARYFERFVGIKGTFKEQIDADKRILTMGWAERMGHREEFIGHVRGAHATQDLIHNILNTILQLELAVDWDKVPEDLKIEYVNGYFEEANVDEIAAMKSSVSNREFKRWYSKERTRFLESHEKYMAARKWTLTLYEEFGSIVLLDARWNPSKFGRDSRSKSFESFLVFLLANLPMRRATSDELIEFGGQIKYVDGRGTVKYNLGTRNDNDALVLAIVKYITRRTDIVTYVEEFIKRTGKGKKL